MKNFQIIALITGTYLSSCTKKNDPKLQVSQWALPIHTETIDGDSYPAIAIGIRTWATKLLIYCFFLSILLLPAIGFGQSINVVDAYVRPQLMLSSDGQGGTNSTYFHFHGNQIEEINEKFNGHSSFTIIDRKEVSNAVYYTIKGNNSGKIFYLTIRSTKNSQNQTANELIFESPGEFKETYMVF